MDSYGTDSHRKTIVTLRGEEMKQRWVGNE
jgi:hypothetical protein